MITIYVFSDEDFVPKYIGKAKNFSNRIKQHLTSGRIRYQHTHFYRWLNKTISFEKIFYIDILEECSEEIWQEKEKYWIQYAKDCGYKLCNMTDGGDGNNNQQFSAESLVKKANAMRGKTHTEETKEKLSKIHTGKKLSEETKEKIRKVNQGKKYSEEQKLVCAKKVYQYDTKGNLINIHNSLTIAADSVGTRKGAILNSMNKKRSKVYRGYIWVYNICTVEEILEMSKKVKLTRKINK